MRNSTRRLFLVHQIVFAIAIFVSFDSVVAQQGNSNQAPSSGSRGNIPEELRPPSIKERSFKMDQIERDARQPHTPREEKIAFAQISEDFRELQVINNNMMRVSMPAKELDYLMIAESLTKIRKRVVRLKENLGFPELDLKASKKDKYEPAQNIDDLKARLLTLDGSIMRFVKSPIFQNAATVVDLKEAAKARKEVEYIINTTQLISKDAERLQKNSAKNN